MSRVCLKQVAFKTTPEHSESFSQTRNFEVLVQILMEKYPQGVYSNSPAQQGFVGCMGLRFFGVSSGVYPVMLLVSQDSGALSKIRGR